MTNDDSLGSEYQQLGVRGGYADAAVIETPALARVAEAFGAEGDTVRSVEDVDSIADQLASTSDGPIVVDCTVDRDVIHRFYETMHEM